MAVTTAGSIVAAQRRRTAYARLRRIVAALFWQWAEASLLSDPFAYSHSSRSGQRYSLGRNGDGDDAEFEFKVRDDDGWRTAFGRDGRGRRLTGTPVEAAATRFTTVADGGSPLDPDQTSGSFPPATPSAPSAAPERMRSGSYAALPQHVRG